MSELATAKGWHFARVTLETVSPLSCGAGQGLDGDNAIVRDANGLPMIPGTTLQGLLRAAYQVEGKDNLFGSAEPITASRLTFSNALVHDSHNIAVQFPAETEVDNLLMHLMKDAPLKRDHVRLDHRHTAAKGGKFDRVAVPAGTRFSFELMLFGAEDEGGKLRDVLSGLKDETFRIGSSGNRGYGKIAVTQANGAFYAVGEALALRKIRNTPLSSTEEKWSDLKLCAPAAPLTISLKLTPINPWRAGQNGMRGAEEVRKSVAAPIRESKITWLGNEGAWTEPLTDNKTGYVLPGSSLRGPLAHRALFHWNVQNGQFIDPDTTTDIQPFLDNKAQLDTLFGNAREDGTGGQVSALIFEDIDISPSKVRTVDHNKIDRFTGGVLQGALYSEELLNPAELNCTIRVHPNRAATICVEARAAFLAGLRDLVEGRLALGAKSYGFCKGTELTFTGAGAEEWNAAYAAPARENGA